MNNYSPLFPYPKELIVEDGWAQTIHSISFSYPQDLRKSHTQQASCEENKEINCAIFQPFVCGLRSDTHSSLCYLTLISIHFLKRISLHKGDLPNKIQIDSNYSHDAAASCGPSILLMVSKWFMFSKFIITAVLPNREGQVNSLPTETAHGWIAHNFSLSLFKVICVVVGLVLLNNYAAAASVRRLLLLLLFAVRLFSINY